MATLSYSEVRALPELREIFSAFSQVHMLYEQNKYSIPEAFFEQTTKIVKDFNAAISKYTREMGASDYETFWQLFRSYFKYPARLGVYFAVKNPVLSGAKTMQKVEQELQRVWTKNKGLFEAFRALNLEYLSMTPAYFKKKEEFDRIGKEVKEIINEVEDLCLRRMERQASSGTAKKRFDALVKDLFPMFHDVGVATIVA